MVLEAVKKYGRALSYSHGELKADKQVVLEAVKQDGRALGYSPGELKADKQVALEAVKQDRRALGYSRGDQGGQGSGPRGIKQNGFALQYASLALRNGGLKTYLVDLCVA